MFQIINVSNIITQQEIFYQIFFGTEERYQSSKSIKVSASKHHDVGFENEWNFNPPLVPHFGGIWERLLPVFKLSLYKIIGSRTLTDETLSPFNCEIEFNDNSRPLTNSSSDINDPLPPNTKPISSGWNICQFSPVFFREKDWNLKVLEIFITLNLAFLEKTSQRISPKSAKAF